MNETLEAIVEADAGGGFVVKAPRVGIYRGAPRAGGRRGAGDAIGRLTVLNRHHDIVLPSEAGGIVADVKALDRAVPVEYGQELFRLAPDGAAAPSLSRAAAASESPAAGLPEGASAVTCPIDGVFYRRPSPAAAPFVQPGDVVETGRTLGLIEAMKSFNAVPYGGAGLPGRAVVVEARAEDASEVRQGAILFVVRPA